MSFSLSILGCSSALPTSQRFPTAQVLNVSEQFYLIDCGEGTQIQLRKNKIKLGRINNIFISHLHGDHFFGIFGLLSTFSLLGRKTDLHIFAPPELEAILASQMNYIGLLQFKIHYHKTQAEVPEVILDNDRISVETIPLKHRVPTTGFLFREKPRMRNIRKEAIEYYNMSVKDIISVKNGNDLILSDGIVVPNQQITNAPSGTASYAYCSDTIYTEKIIPQISNIDVLFHEATYSENLRNRAQETFHSTAAQAATIAKKANVGKLIIGHYSARYKNANELLSEAEAVFPNVYAAEDGKVFDF